MAADVYLHFAALFVSYFVKVAVAYLLCWLLARLLGTPRQRFGIWLAFMLGSAGYWVYSITSSSFATTATTATAVTPAATVSRIPRIVHQFLVPARFEHPTLFLGRSLIFAYMIGVLLLFLGGMWKRMRLHFLLRQGEAPSGELQHLFTEMCRHFRVRHCQLVVLAKADSPATVYWWRPRIVLPQLCEEVGDGALLADILYHELAHVARRDYFWSSVNDLICRMLFFHPAVWQARKQMQIHREMACDMAVVAARPEHRADYADTLTRVARLCLPRKSPVIGIDFAAAPSFLTHRVHAILRDPEKGSWMKNLSRLIAGVGLTGAFGCLCSALALAVAFAPPSRLQSADASVAVHKAPVHLASRHMIRHELASHPDVEEGLITESPAYRMRSSSGSSANEPGLGVGSEDGFAAEAGDSRGPGWTGHIPGSVPRSGGATLQGLIVATVGTVLGADKDDHKRKDSSHFQAPAGVLIPY